VTAQAGIASGGVHGYAEIGAAFARDRYSIIDSNGVAPDESDRVSDTRGGVVIGVGLELPMSGGWSARGEYNYINFGRSEYAISGDLWQIDQTMHVFRVGVLYRFGG
jgi:opacity protein-like surface antigen